MGHVTLDKVSSRQGSHQRELTRQDGGADDASQLAGVLTRSALTGALNAEHLESTDIQQLSKTPAGWYKNRPKSHSGRCCCCTCRQACCGGRLVPPPTVPSSMEGMVQLTYRSSPSGPAASIWVMQLELPTVWAGSYSTIPQIFFTNSYSSSPSLH